MFSGIACACVFVQLQDLTFIRLCFPLSDLFLKMLLQENLKNLFFLVVFCES